MTSKSSILSSISENIIIIAAFVYFVGYVYIYYYYSALGLSIGELKPATYSFFVYSFNVFQKNKVWIILIILLMISFQWYIHKKDTNAIRSVRIVFLVALLPMLFYISKRAADKDSFNVRNDRTSPVVCFYFSGPVPGLPADFVSSNNCDYETLLLLAENKETYFVLYQPVNHQIDGLLQGKLFHIPKKSVSSAEIRLPDRTEP